MSTRLELLRSSHSVHQLGYHIIWCTKYRHKVLTKEAEIVVKNVVSQACTTYGWKVRAIEVMDDHVHLFVQLSPDDAPATVAKTLKSISAVAVFSQFPDIKKQRFWGSGLWSSGTYYATVGQISQETVIKYIEEQKTIK